MPGFKVAAHTDPHLAGLRENPDYGHRFREVVGEA
jgi:hypothetical protein